jgi:hypothetical protein
VRQAAASASAAKRLIEGPLQLQKQRNDALHNSPVSASTMRSDMPTASGEARGALLTSGALNFHRKAGGGQAQQRHDECICSLLSSSMKLTPPISSLLTVAPAADLDLDEFRVEEEDDEACGEDASTLTGNNKAPPPAIAAPPPQPPPQPAAAPPPQQPVVQPVALTRSSARLSGAWVHISLFSKSFFPALCIAQRRAC